MTALHAYTPSRPRAGARYRQPGHQMLQILSLHIVNEFCVHRARTRGLHHPQKLAHCFAVTTSTHLLPSTTALVSCCLWVSRHVVALPDPVAGVRARQGACGWDMLPNQLHPGRRRGRRRRRYGRRRRSSRHRRRSVDPLEPTSGRNDRRRSAAAAEAKQELTEIPFLQGRSAAHGAESTREAKKYRSKLTHQAYMRTVRGTEVGSYLRVGRRASRSGTAARVELQPGSRRRTGSASPNPEIERASAAPSLSPSFFGSSHRSAHDGASR